MQVSATSYSNPATQGTSSAPTQDMSDTFLKLLVAQLKSQSPLEPVDPNQFVGQLAQFNTLSEIIRIREAVELAVPSSTAGSQSSSTGGD